jgi:hypothetical protein
MSRRDRSWLYFTGYCIVLIIAILGLFYPQQQSQQNGVDVTVALEDNTNQSLIASNTWTSIRYSTNIHVSSAWNHTAGDEKIECLREGIYRLYFSIQPTLNNTQPQTLYFCKACNLYQQIRATIQYGGVGMIEEISSSHTHGDREARFLSKSVLLYASPTDVIRIQFKSQCPNVIIGATPTSSTMIISNA